MSTFDKKPIKIGDLVQWHDYCEQQYVPIPRIAVGVVCAKMIDDHGSIKLTVLDLKGKKTILHPEYETDIEVISG